jgi:phosphatidate cytidylyltransferase
MLLSRIFSAILLVAIIIATVYLRWLFNIAIVVFIAIGLYEFFTMLEKKGIMVYKYFGVGMGIVIPLSIILDFRLTKKWELLFIVLALLFLILMQFRRRQNTGVIVDISATLFGILYVSWFLSFLIKIRYLPGGSGLMAAILLITKLGDIGAYLVGSRFGKTPFMPRISPKKTVEGAVAGLAFSVLGALVSKVFLNFSYLHLIFVGVCFGMLGQVGDLSESLLKRDCNVKDAGKILPGMGGMLDELDSLLFTAPVFYFYLNSVLS